MKQKLLRKLKRTFKSFSANSGKTALGTRGEEQVKKFYNLGQEMIVMRMG